MRIRLSAAVLCAAALSCCAITASCAEEITPADVSMANSSALGDQNVSEEDNSDGTQVSEDGFDNTEENSDEKSDEGETEAQDTDDSDAEEIDPDVASGKYDPIVVNEDVENAVAENNPEAVSVSGYYGFSYSGFDSVYSNEELEKCFDRLQEICDNASFRLSFAYKNMDTDAYVGYNVYEQFRTCSTIKAPYVKCILEQGINLDEVITKTYIWPGDDETVATAADGKKFTAKQLIEYTIDESDNTAYYMLVNTFGYVDFNNMLYSLGASYRLGSSWIFTNCTCLDMLYCYEDIYDFGQTNEYGEWLVELLSDTDLNIQIGKALGAKYQVAQKYGSEFSEWVFNDCAIVYADSPFVLTIFTGQYPESEESCQVFKELAVVFDDINTLIAQ